jgi:hypothetical protein
MIGFVDGYFAQNSNEGKAGTYSLQPAATITASASA